MDSPESKGKSFLPSVLHQSIQPNKHLTFLFYVICTAYTYEWVLGWWMDLWGVICRNKMYIGLCYVNKHKYWSADLSTALLHRCGGSRIESGSGSICADPPHLLYTVHLLPIWDPGLHQSGHCVEPQHLMIGITSRWNRWLFTHT